jgi:pyruvate/2-oxoglutarate dehydrogenase complex dihydrolipoamide acyltransferase (E2) component
MATSAATLSSILSTLSKRFDIDEGEMTKLLKGKGLLPKKLSEAPKVTKEKTNFASKAAEELAAEHGLSWEVGGGTGKDGKVTIKDVKDKLTPVAQKVNASAAAVKYCLDNHLDISRIATGSGNQGRIVLTDVKDLHDPDPPADSDTEEDSNTEDELNLSPDAQKIVKKYDLDAEDLEEAGVKGTGKKGKILGKDLKKLVEELEQDA